MIWQKVDKSDAFYKFLFKIYSFKVESQNFKKTKFKAKIIRLKYVANILKHILYFFLQIQC